MRAVRIQPQCSRSFISMILFVSNSFDPGGPGLDISLINMSLECTALLEPRPTSPATSLGKFEIESNSVDSRGLP